MDKENVVQGNITQPSKKMKSCYLWPNIDGPRGYYTKWNKSERDKQKLYDFIYMWNLENKTNEQQ